MERINVFEISRTALAASPTLTFMLGAVSAYRVAHAYKNSIDRRLWIMIGTCLMLALVCTII